MRTVELARAATRATPGRAEAPVGGDVVAADLVREELGHEQVAGGVYRDRVGLGIETGDDRRLAVLRNCPRGRESLQARVSVVGDPDVARRIDGDVVRDRELSRAGSPRSPFAHEATAGIELLDAIAACVRDVDGTLSVDADAGRTGELSVPAA